MGKTDLIREKLIVFIAEKGSGTDKQQQKF